MAQKDSDKIKTTPAEGKIAASVLDAVLEFCETNGHQPNPESLLGTLYAAIYAYDHSKRHYDKNENDEMYADKLHRARAFTSYGRKKIRDAGKEISIRKAEKNAVGIERVFPRAKLVQSEGISWLTSYSSTIKSSFNKEAKKLSSPSPKVSFVTKSILIILHNDYSRQVKIWFNCGF